MWFQFRSVWVLSINIVVGHDKFWNGCYWKNRNINLIISYGANQHNLIIMNTQPDKHLATVCISSTIGSTGLDKSSCIMIVWLGSIALDNHLPYYCINRWYWGLNKMVGRHLADNITSFSWSSYFDDNVYNAYSRKYAIVFICWYWKIVSIHVSIRFFST